MTKNEFIAFCRKHFGTTPVYQGSTKTFYITGYKYSYALYMVFKNLLGKTPPTQIKNIISLRDSSEAFTTFFKKQYHTPFNIVAE